MLPTYIKLGGFDTEHTRFASKYNLYLYRERGVDDYSEEDIGVCCPFFFFFFFLATLMTLEMSMVTN